ncbi:MAG: PDZ domain-containing protein [Planctomycetota bacterium]
MDNTTRKRSLLVRLMIVAMLGSGCRALPDGPLPLGDVEERDEIAFTAAAESEFATRNTRPIGTFSGLEVSDSRATLAERLGASNGLLVTRIVENSPAVAAGFEVGDLLFEAVPPTGGPQILNWPSDWYRIEDSTPAGSVIEIGFEREGRESTASLTLAARMKPRDAVAPQRYREEERVGVVLREATDVEAQQAGITRASGAVVVGLSRSSPWRQAGIQLGDVIVGIGGKPVGDPREMIDAIANGESGDRLALEVVRGAERIRCTPRLSAREKEMREIAVPPLFGYRNERGRRRTSVLLGFFKYESTAVAWRTTVCWLFAFSGGDADRLQELGP